MGVFVFANGGEDLLESDPAQRRDSQSGTRDADGRAARFGAARHRPPNLEVRIAEGLLAQYRSARGQPILLRARGQGPGPASDILYDPARYEQVFRG